MNLTAREQERYNRHLLVKSVGEEGQLKLRQAGVLVIGAGGLGCPVIQYLVAAGVGRIGIVDNDTVSLSNLQRQILYTEDEIGKSKAAIAGKKMTKLNALVDIQIYEEWLTETSADNLFREYDIVVGATDNYNSRYLIDQKSVAHHIPFVHGAISELGGQLSVFNYQGSGSYQSLFGDKPQEPPTLSGVVGAIPGIIGSMMAMETIKIITDIGHVLSGKLLLYSAIDNSFNQITY